MGMRSLKKFLTKDLQKKSEPTPREYLDNLTATVNMVKKFDRKSAEFLLDREQEKDKYKHAERLIKYQHELEQEINGFEHGSFNVHRVKNTDENTVDEVEKLGYKTEKEVFVSIGSNNGFELLNAIDKELKTRDVNRTPKSRHESVYFLLSARM